MTYMLSAPILMYPSARCLNSHSTLGATQRAGASSNLWNT